jgi:hypothetical protein
MRGARRRGLIDAQDYGALLDDLYAVKRDVACRLDALREVRGHPESLLED